MAIGDGRSPGGVVQARPAKGNNDGSETGLRLALGLTAVGVAVLAMPSVAFAQEAAERPRRRRS